MLVPDDGIGAVHADSRVAFGHWNEMNLTTIHKGSLQKARIRPDAGGLEARPSVELQSDILVGRRARPVTREEVRNLGPRRLGRIDGR